MADAGDKKPKPKKKKQELFDLVNRGDKSRSVAGTLTFVGLRTLDLPLQYLLLSRAGPAVGASLLRRLGIATVTAAALHTGLPWLDGLGAGGALLLAMAAGATAKQVYWAISLSAERFPPGAATTVAVFNSAINSINALLFLASATTSLRSAPAVSIPFVSSSPVPLSVVVGAVLYVSGLAIETTAELQRRAFKRRPENRGKVCKVGLWGWARHVNYFGYALWRGAYCMAATGWVGGIAMGLWQGWDFATRAVEVLDEYCSGRYGEQWTRFKEEVPYKLIPGIY
ncbi:hypothetical protein F4779DRAFT_527423 [Xylariaceae sp. FL0662B]|nr:hypothetical protein F4779DRAFT_527423 [Xylariaceae sp. FL0662B]